MLSVFCRKKKKNYESAKTEFKQSWTQASSTTMNSGLFSDISRIKHDLSNATTSDERLKNILKGAEADIQILKLGPNNPKLRALFDNIQATPSQADHGSSLLDLDQTQDDSAIDSFLEFRHSITWIIYRLFATSVTPTLSSLKTRYTKMIFLVSSCSTIKTLTSKRLCSSLNLQNSDLSSLSLMTQLDARKFF